MAGMRWHAHRLFHVWMLLVLGAATLAALVPAAASAAPPPLNLSSATQLAAFVDPYVTRSMAAAHVPGAVVAFVDNGTVVYERGFGYANLAQKTPVDPQTTLFRVASVSKVLTTAAVMQLADRGRLRLDTDVNRYLRGFQVPPTYPEPVTLSELLTHTAGFEDRTLDIATLNARDVQPLGVYLATRMPARVTPPGSIFSYSNYSFALAGYVVQSVSGQLFDQYLAGQVFGPLGMEHTSFAQPLPPSLASRRATGYDVTGASVTPAPFEYFDDAPADAMSTTAADMGRFMIEQLGAGKDPVLSASARADMQRAHFQAVPGPSFDAMAYGYQRYQRNGVTILSKEGDVRGYASYLSLLPDQHFGFFVAANSNDSSWMQDLEHQLVSRAFPKPPEPAPVTPPGLRGALGEFTGTYIPARSSHTTVEKLRVATEEITVADAGGERLIVTYPDGSALRLTQIAPLVFAYAVDGVTFRWPFLRGSRGRVDRLLIGNDTYNRLPWYATNPVQLPYVAVLVLVFLSLLGAWMIPASVRRLRRWTTRARLPVVRNGRAVAGPRPLGALIGALNAVFVVALVVVLLSASATQDLGYSWLTYDRPTILYALLCLPLLSIAATVALIALTAVRWRRQAWTRGQLAYGAIVLLAEAAFIPLLLYWNLLGFHV
ncbi:MAG TPA: serine hydrolase domain-containing protein [Thermomicrobiaceae bacterium]|nr:serine hydrolase domain-containing protein [Thermomicrobiaceae bacterium]